MHRSFTDRVLAGVCGGLATSLRLNAWVLRVTFVILTFVTMGVAALLYVSLWWMLPQESLIQQLRGNGMLSIGVLLVTVLLLGAWLGQQMGWLSSNQSILAPTALLMISIVFFMRQVRGA